MLTEPHFRPVRDDEVVIGIKAVPHLDVVAVVAPEGRREYDVPAHLAEELLQHRRLPFPVAGMQRVEPSAQILPLPDLRLILRIITPLKEAPRRHNRFSVLINYFLLHISQCRLKSLSLTFISVYFHPLSLKHTINFTKGLFSRLAYLR